MTLMNELLVTTNLRKIIQLKIWAKKKISLDLSDLSPLDSVLSPSISK